MSRKANFDVVVVGAGPAGITAAICLAKSDFLCSCSKRAFPGAENWSGAVYFSETLTRPDVLGLDELERGAIERRVVKRGFYVYNATRCSGSPTATRRRSKTAIPSSVRIRSLACREGEAVRRHDPQRDDGGKFDSRGWSHHRGAYGSRTGICRCSFSRRRRRGASCDQGRV